MAASVALITAALRSRPFNEVGVFTQDFTQIFTNAKAIKAVVKEQSKTMEHPVETGIVITDHRIILPVEIDLSLILTSETYQDVYKSIKQYYLNATLLVVQTRSDTYQNQIISSMPHEEDPTQFDVLLMALNLKQVQFVTPQYGVVPKKAKNSTTQARGVQQGTVAKPVQQTAAKSALDFIKRPFSS
jgi:hypothetical protein